MGLVFESFTVLSGPYKNGENRTVYECECICGSIKRFTPSALRQRRRKGYKYCRECSPNLKPKDISGTVFGRLTAVRRIGTNKYRISLWECLCACGNSKVTDMNTLRTGRIKSCGCSPARKEIESLKGRVFGRLTVLEYVGQDKYGQSTWICICTCGTRKSISRGSLINGATLSCGCLNRENKKGQKGPFNPNWNFLLTVEDRKQQGRPPEVKTWAQKIKEKYNYTCFVCSKSGGALVSHHLNSYSVFPNLRTDIKNGVCLCESCHKKFHKEYGNKENTKEQFDVWLSKVALNPPADK